MRKHKIITRNQRNKQEANKYHSIFHSQAFKHFHKGNKGNKSAYLERRLRKNMNVQKQIQDQNIVINLNLGQYGFDSQISSQPIHIIEDIVTNCQFFSVNPNPQGIQWKKLCQQLTNRFQVQNFVIQSKNTYFTCDGKSKRLIEISKEEYILLECIHQIFTKMKQGSKSPGLIGTIQSETEPARKILQKCKSTISQLQLIEKWKQISNFRQQYLKQLALKTFSLGLKDLVINQLSYFLEKQFQQNSRNNRNAKTDAKIQNWQQWSQFIQKKRVRLRKAHKFLLHTACQLCLSDHSQLENPILNCSQCHIRGHKLCLNPSKQNRCGRCVYLRLSNDMKQKIPQCFLCNVKNLVPLKITSSRFVHIFCIMAHQMWQLANQKIVMSNAEEIIELQKQKQKQLCKFCNKQSQYCSRCQNCQSYSHYLCAYMNGSQFQILSEGRIKFYCCQIDTVKLQRIAYQRKYILNYNNLVFKKLSQVQSALKVIKRNRINEQQSENELYINMDVNLRVQNIPNQQLQQQNQIDHSYQQLHMADFESS